MRWISILLLGSVSLSAAAAEIVKCPATTSKTADVVYMMDKVLGYKAPLSKRLMGSVMGVPTSIRMSDKGGGLQFQYIRNQETTGAAVACENKGEIKLISSSAAGSFTFYLKAKGSNSVRVGMKGVPGSASFTAQ